MSAQRSCTVIKETLTSPSSQSSTKRCNARRAEDTMQKGKSFCTCGVTLREASVEKTKLLNSKTAQVMIRLCGLQWTGGLTRHLIQEAQDATKNFTGRHKGRISKVAQTVGKNTQTIASAARKIAPRANHGKLGQHRKTTSGTQKMTPEQKQAHFGN